MWLILFHPFKEKMDYSIQVPKPLLENHKAFAYGNKKTLAMAENELAMVESKNVESRKDSILIQISMTSNGNCTQGASSLKLEVLQTKWLFDNNGN